MTTHDGAQRILRLLAFAPATRGKLIEEAALNKGTVDHLLRKLLARRLIEVGGYWHPPNTRGRPARVFRVCPLPSTTE